jgi:hypothetical protein
MVELHPDDVETFDDGKGDGSSVFDRHRVIGDDTFVDTAIMDASSVQAFLEVTPYGTRSFLADERVNGERVSDALVRVARGSGLNPLVLLAMLQKEAGLISRTRRPSTFLVDYAFGCGCHDGRGCATSLRGIDRQLECAVDVLRGSFDAGTNGDATNAGYRLGQSFTSLDDLRVTPQNRATLALYTYTPWVGQASRGGNWLFWNVFRKYADAVGYEAGLTRPFNEGFIGGACTTDSECAFTGGFCHTRGFCTLRCTASSPYCPDRAGHATTFCVDLDGTGSTTGEGLCVAQCDAFSPRCLTGQSCEPMSRLGQSTTHDVCR